MRGYSGTKGAQLGLASVQVGLNEVSGSSLVSHGRRLSAGLTPCPFGRRLERAR
jgi:hypothetical protein